MSRGALELQVLRKQTEAFIAADPTAVPLTRRTRQANGAGGWRFVAPNTILPVQQFHIVAAGENVVLREGPDGRQVATSHNIVGAYDADIQKFDLFEYNGIPYMVLWVNADLEYVTHAEAAPR